jgi:hypothetical protein
MSTRNGPDWLIELRPASTVSSAGFAYRPKQRTKSCNGRFGRGTFVGQIMVLSSEYHRRQATTLTQLAQTTRNLDTAKALLRMAAEHLVQADETLRVTEPTDKPGIDRRRDPS